MFELPECAVISSQINKTLKGKIIESASLGNSPHKFVWYNMKHEEFAKSMKDKKIGEAYSRGRWMFVDINPGYVMVIGECGGKILYHEDKNIMPKKYHLLIHFNDGTAFSVTTQMWGAMELYKKGEEKNRKYIKDMKPTPVDKEFTFAYFNKLIDECEGTDVKSVKGILTQNQVIPGLGNSIAQDIMFKASLDPKHSIKNLTQQERKNLYTAIIKTTREIISKGGRYDEYDLFNNNGRYIRLMDKNSAGKPCSKCGEIIKKIQYLGGACYYCPKCQI